MNLAQLVERPPIEPWTGRSKIPWHEPDFSRRMLREHLDQQHGAASRNRALIDRQVEWIHREMLGATPSRVLDLGCGPGFYTERLAALGHSCVGIDFSPASIEHADARARHCALSAQYRLADIRDGAYGPGFDAALLVFGEFNAFRPAEADGILRHIGHSLVPGGKLILEPHTAPYLRQLGHRAPNWFSAKQSVFSDRPHLCLHESRWHESAQATTDQYFVVDADSMTITEYTNTLQAYSDETYESMLEGAGFRNITRHASLTGRREPDQAGLFVLVAETLLD